MCATPVRRKLAAILAADAVGYSRLMAADEEGTMKILAAHRAVIDGIIEFHEGRIISTAGDSVLAEFGSPVEAVRCAVEVQDALKTRNDSLPEDQRLQFRIGVNLGDVMEKGADLLGDGVNVAARLESIAEPGGICVSSSIYDQISGKLDLGFVDIGDQSLKNIQRPIHVYRVDRESRRATGSSATQTSRPATATWLAGALAAIVVAAVLAWYFDLLPVSRQAERAGVPAPAADERAKMEVDLAKARAEAEGTRRKADAELARASEARRTAEADAKAAATAKPPAAPKTTPTTALPAVAGTEVPRAAAEVPAAAPSRRYAGRWAAAFSCPASEERPAFNPNVRFSVTDDTFVVQYGERDQPGSFRLHGIAEPDGRLQFVGVGVSRRRQSFGQAYNSEFEGKFDGERYEATGHLGRFKCALTISRAQ